MALIVLEGRIRLEVDKLIFCIKLQFLLQTLFADSGGFVSHKPDSVVAVKKPLPQMRSHHNGFNGESPSIRRESVIMARNNPYLADMDARNGNIPPKESIM